MNSVCFKSSIVKKAIGVASSLGVSLTLATSAFAQTASTGSATTKGGTSSSLPAAGSTELTYLVFGFGVLVFVAGMMKLVKSFRD